MKYPDLNLYSNVFDLDDEVWLDIKGWEDGYQVSNFGRVRTKTREVLRNTKTGVSKLTKRGVVKIVHNDSRGYPTVQLSFQKTKATKRVHRLVAEHFLVPPSQGLVDACRRHGKVFVNHIDGDKLNPNVENLEWCNQTHNCYHAITDEIKEKLSGESSYNAKLSKDEVLSIVEMYRGGGYSQQTLADMFGIKQITVSNILTGKSWSSVTGIPKQDRKFKNTQLPMVESEIKVCLSTS